MACAIIQIILWYLFNIHLPTLKSTSEQGQGGHMARAVMKPWLQFAVQAVRLCVSWGLVQARKHDVRATRLHMSHRPHTNTNTKIDTQRDENKFYVACFDNSCVWFNPISTRGGHIVPPLLRICVFLCKYAYELVEKTWLFSVMSLEKGSTLFTP